MTYCAKKSRRSVSTSCRRRFRRNEWEKRGRSIHVIFTVAFTLTGTRSAIMRGTSLAASGHATGTGDPGGPRVYGCGERPRPSAPFAHHADEVPYRRRDSVCHLSGILVPAVRRAASL